MPIGSWMEIQSAPGADAPVHEQEPQERAARLAAMPTHPTVARSRHRRFWLALPLILIIAACGSAAAPSPSPGTESPRSTPTAVPGVGGGGGGAGSGGNTGGGVDPGNPGGGGGVNPFPIPPGPFQDPLLGEATTVVPVPGRLNPHPVNVQLVRAAVDDGAVWAELRWWSGVEECYATDSVRIERDEATMTIRLTVIEGSNQGDVACIDIGILKATVVDLGALAAGTWTISAEGDAKAITVEVA